MSYSGNSGLDLIHSYSDDDEDESDNNTLNNLKPKDHCDVSVKKDNSILNKSENSSKRLPLPSSILQLYKGNSDANSATDDNPDLHDGRIRSFPHQRGNWSTYVYIPYEQEDGFEDLLLRLQMCTAQIGVQLKTAPEPHISLTRTVVLLHHWIDTFVNSIKSKLCRLPRFSIQLGPPAVYCNEERTRTFLGLSIVTGSSQLCEAANILDSTLAEFRLPPFYKDPSFHMSVLWVVGDFQQVLQAALPQLVSEFEAYAAEYPQELHIDVTQCLCKTGNKMFVFPLAA